MDKLTKYEPHKIEPFVLEFWEKNKIYAKANGKGKPFYFLDGPPYTSGKIHLGIAWNKSLKDCVMRYKRMNGFDVWDRAGYDMHGLPTELKVQAKFKLKSKDEVPKFGVSKFINECKKFSTENMEMMNKDFRRLGVWMDFKNAYQSIRNEFMEGEWWLVKKAHENKRLYEGKLSMQWCQKCATALAKHELEYKNVKDNSIFVKFKVKKEKNEYLVIWTTTPWTIPYNLAVMVNPDLDYVKAKVGSEVWIVAKALAGALIQGVADKKLEIIEEFKGDKLKGVHYEHPFYKELKQVYDDLSKNSAKVHSVVLSKEYVDTSAGSGLVHTAPGCGPEDFEVGHREKIPPFNNLDQFGVFPENMGKFAGLIAKKDDQKFVEALKETGALIETTEVEHEYAHCWRCKAPVIFRTTKQWFFKVEDMKEKMRNLNKKIKWQPDWAGNRQFDSWLDNLRDNGITRQRYWGTAVPIWRCNKCKDYVVVGSIKELKELADKVPDDLHRPYIDEVEITCKCGGVKKRIPDILDVWIDAGTTSWNCLDYPQKTELFKKYWPADFILEGKDQIRGWFNLLFVASMVSMQKPSYKAVYMHGFVQDSQGRKMSKSLGNIISPYEVIDKYGADTLRYYMIGGANPGLDINYNFDDLKIKHKNLMILWNLHKFLIDLAKTLKVNPSSLKISKFSLEEKYILSKLNSSMRKITKLFDDYKMDEIPWLIEDLFLDLSRTYIQLTREKTALGKLEDRKKVLYTVYNVLFETLKLFAPIAPFITEYIYQDLRKEFKLKEESIHLYKWPKYDEKFIDKELELDMGVVQQALQSILACREKIQMGVRWPLKEVVIVTKDEKAVKAIEKFGDILKVQANFKEIKVQQTLPGLKQKVRADYKQINPDFKELAPKIIARLSTDSAETVLNHLEKDGKYEINVNGKKVAIVKEHLIIEREVPIPYEEVSFRQGFIYLNKELTPELEAEGYSREVMRRVQALRKKSGLQKKDKIVLFIKTDEELVEMLNKFSEQIKEKVGASKLKISQIDPSKRHEFKSKELVKEKSFELWFDKV